MLEETLILGAEDHLVATVTAAEHRLTSAPALIAVLTNSGVIPRTGPHRMNVHLARRLAEMGIPSIRFDMSGLGDSRRSSGTLPVVQQWIADTRSVMDSAQARFGCDRFFMVGFCSGAEVAHKVALEDPRMKAVVLWDLYAYPTLQSRLRTFAYRLRRAGLRGAFRKLLARTVRALRATGPARGRPDDPRPVDMSLVPSADEFARRIQTLVDREVEVMFAFCGGEPEWFSHSGQFRAMFRRYAFVDKVAFNHLEHSDHLLTRRVAQQSFVQMVVHWLDQRVLPTSTRRTAQIPIQPGVRAPLIASAAELQPPPKQRENESTVDREPGRQQHRHDAAMAADPGMHERPLPGYRRTQ